MWISLWGFQMKYHKLVQFLKEICISLFLSSRWTVLVCIQCLTLFEKLKSRYKRIPKVELINNLKGAYYRVDLRIKWFFLQTGCGAIYYWKNGIPSNVSNQKNNAMHCTNFLRPSTLLLCKKNYLLVKKHKKMNFVIFQRRFMSQILPCAHKFECARGKIWWHKSPMKNDKVHFSVFFH